MKPLRISIKTFRRRLASIDSVPQFAILGICSGLVTGLVIILFRKMVEIPLEYLLPGNKDNFEGLDLPFLVFEGTAFEITRGYSDQGRH